MSPEPATIVSSEVHLIDSKHTGRKYRITVSLPLAYDPPEGENWPFDRTMEKWPVVYVLDGNWYAGMVTELIRAMCWCGSTTDAIVVGIGYPHNENSVDWLRASFTRRNADMTPIRDEAEEKSMEAHHKRPAPNGDASNFLKFIQQELAPMIENSYRADPSKRILVGHSYGGLFGAFAMFEAPDLFQTLVMGSPTLTYGDRWTLKREEAFAKANKALPAKVYLFVGEHEEDAKDTTMTDTLRFGAVLEGRNYEGFSLVKHVFLDQNHCEVAAPGFQWGLKHALKS